MRSFAVVPVFAVLVMFASSPASAQAVASLSPSLSSAQDPPRGIAPPLFTLSSTGTAQTAVDTRAAEASTLASAAVSSLDPLRGDARRTVSEVATGLDLNGPPAIFVGKNTPE